MLPVIKKNIFTINHLNIDKTVLHLEHQLYK